MNMSKKLLTGIVAAVFFFLGGFVSSAQEGTYSIYTPYSIYGLGDMMSQGSAHNAGMGGVGVATRNKKFVNYLNPAAVTARDTLSFMADFAIKESNILYKEGDLTSGKNLFNITNLALSFPVYKSSAIMLGMTPYSNVGYSIGSLMDIDDSILGNTGNVVDAWKGQGSVNQLFISAGATFWKKLSIGIEGIQYFGTVEKGYERAIEQTSFRGYSSGFNFTLRGTGVKFGLQYEQRLGGDYVLGIGATYKTNSKMKGFIETYSDTTYVSDSLNLAKGAARYADELAVGLSIRSGEKWRLEFDYSRADWSKSRIDEIPGMRVVSQLGSTFKASVAESFRAGFEITPNVNDIRYYLKRCTYRAGAYYDKAYYTIDGNNVYSFGITFGATLPVFKLYNGVTFGVELGQRGSLSANQIRERYANFTFSFNVHDIWFQKPRFD